jgi:hypothetical protein
VKGVGVKGWGSCYQAGDQSGWEFATMSKARNLPSKKLGVIYFPARVLINNCLTLCEYQLIVHYVNITEIIVYRLKINHAWSALSSCV